MGTFVTPEVVRLHVPLPDQEDAWIEIKRELTVGELKRMRAAGLTNVQNAEHEEDRKLGIDMARMQLAKAEAFIVDWNLRDHNGKVVPVTKAAISALSEAAFELIDAAIDAHRTKLDAEAGKTSASETTSTTNSEAQ